jgi:hypothetical protein
MEQGMNEKLHPAFAEHRLEIENERLRGLLRDTAAVAITMLYDSHREDVLAEFTVPELEAVVKASAHLQSAKVEHVYRRAWDAALSQQAEPAPAQHWSATNPGLADQYRAEALAAREALGFAADADDVSPSDIVRAIRPLEPAPAKDERADFEAWFVSKWPANQLYRRDALPASDPHYDEYCNPRVLHAYEGWLARSTRPAQTEQQPVCWASSTALAKLQNGRNNSPCVLTDGPAEFNDTPLFAAPVAQTELVEALRTCEKWFAKHSPTAPLIGGFGDAEHPMLTFIRAALAQHAKEPRHE